MRVKSRPAVLPGTLNLPSFDLESSDYVPLKPEVVLG